MKTLLLAATAMATGIVSCGPTAAQEIFSGLYFGGEGIYFWSDPVVTNVPEPNDFFSEGFAPGVYLGYDVRDGDGVFGVIADIDWLDTSESEYFGKFGGTDYEYGIDWLASARLRMGVMATPSTLLYATGGAGFTSVNASTSVSSINFTGSSSDILTGTVIGLGFDHALNSNWSIKSEYLRYRFGSINAPDPDGPGPGEAARFEPQIDVIKFGIAYHF